MAPQPVRSVGLPRRGPASPLGAGVPLSVQTAIPGPPACLDPRERRACPGRCGPVLAYRVIASFSRSGDLVATAGIGARALAAAAAAAGRSAIILNPGTQPGRQAVLAVSAACTCPTDPGLGGLGADDPGLNDDIQACAAALRPGGLLAVLTSAARAPGQVGRVVARARAAGLGYTQHIVLVHAVIRGDSLDGPLLPPDPHCPLVHAAAHTDLLLFTAPEGTADD
jgi:hypothetical protein